MKNTEHKPIRKLDLALAILIAFASWFFVVYNVNPTVARVYRDIPVKFINEDVLQDNGLAIKSVEFETVDITIEARRNALDNIDAGRIIVNADLAQAGKGENIIALSVTVPNDSTVTKKSNDNIIIEAETLISKEVPTKVEYTGLEDGTTEPQVITQNVDTVVVSGGESRVSEVQTALLSVNAAKLSEDEMTFSIKAVPVDGNGNEVQYVSADPGKVTMTIVNSTLKTVPLNILVENADDGEYHRSYTGPETITIKGRSEVIANIDSIDTRMIDLYGVTDGTQIPLEYNLPEGVSVSIASSDQYLNVSVAKYETTTIEIPASAITVDGLPEGYTATAEGGASVEVTGIAENLSTLTAGDFVVTADASSVYGEGQYDLPISLSTNVDRAALTTDLITFNVTVGVQEEQGTEAENGEGEENTENTENADNTENTDNTDAGE